MARGRCFGCCLLVLLPTLHHLLLLLPLLVTTFEKTTAVGAPQHYDALPLPPVNSPQQQHFTPPSTPQDRLHSRHLARIPQTYPNYDRFPYDLHQSEPPSFNRDSDVGNRGFLTDGGGGYPGRYGSSSRYGDASLNYPNTNLGSSAVDRSSAYDPVLRTAPLTSSKNKSSLGLFSKWGAEKKDVGPNPNSIESSLAAIFRGVAYGVSTAPTTTPKPTTTTTTTTVKPPSNPFQNSSLVGKAPEANVTKSGDAEGNLKPVHHVDSPYQDVGVDGSGYSPPGGVMPSSVSPTTSPTDVRKAGLENWQSDLEGAWEVHVYCSAASFSLLALIALLCIVRVHMSNYLLPRGYYVTAHLLVFLASFFRCIIFFRDPYASGGKLPVALSELLFNTGVPCVTAAFSVVVLALLNCARIILLPLNLQSPLVFGIISCIYIFSNISVDVLAGVFSQVEWTAALKASIQALTAGWTAAMCLGYMIIYYRIEKAALRQRNDMIRLSYNRENLENTSVVPRRLPTLPLSKAARIVLAASLCGLTVAVLQVYGLMTPDGLVQLPPRELWVWFGFQTSCRLLEIIMWSCVCVAAALSSNTSLDKQANEAAQGMTAFSCKNCASCSDLSSCHESNDKKMNDELYPTVCPPNMATRNFRVDVNGKMISADGRPLPLMSNTMGPNEKEKGNRKSSTLHSATSDMHLLWGGQNSNSSTSRPASMIFNDNGMVRFRTQMENGELQDVGGNFPVEEIPPGYMEHVYNVSYQRKPDFPVRDQVYSDGVPSAPHQQLLQNRMAKEMLYGRVIQENGPPNSEACDQNTEYSYSEIPSSHPNDEYVRYASACSSVSAANSFDVRMYDDYEVASYYHSPINGPKSCASSQSHVYASLRPTHHNVTPHKFIRNARVPASSCFSSPPSAVSSVRSSQSPRHLHHHNSDSDLCSSATDRTQASSSQGNEDISENYDNTSIFRPQMRRHLSHPNAIPDDSMDLDEDGQRMSNNDERADSSADQARKLMNRNVNVDHPNPDHRSSPTDSDDIYTPLMEQHLEPQIHSNSPGHTNKHQQNLPNKRQPQYSQLPQHFSPQRQNIQDSIPPHLLGQQFPQNLDSPSAVRSYNVGSMRAHPMPSVEKAVPNQKTSPYRSPPTSPNHHNDTSSPNEDLRRDGSRTSNFSNQLSPNRTRRILDEGGGENLASDDMSDGIYQNNDLPTMLPFTRPTPPPVPDRPSLAETWVHQARDSLTRTEFVRKGSRREKRGTQGSPPNLVLSPVSPVANI